MDDLIAKGLAGEEAKDRERWRRLIKIIDPASEGGRGGDYEVCEGQPAADRRVDEILEQNVNRQR